jgi:NaMN:DMB phosphoribosyltransferase
VLVGGAGVAVSVGIGVAVAVSVGVLVGGTVAVAVLVAVAVAVSVGVTVLVGGTAVFVGVTALISVAAKSTLAVAARVGEGLVVEEPLEQAGIVRTIKLNIPMKMNKSRSRFLMITSPGEKISDCCALLDNQKPLIE